jgi:hypothetical protein
MKPKQSDSDGEKRRGTWHLLHWCLLFPFVVMGWAGCVQDAKVADDADPAGAYALVSVDGKNVPCDIQHDGHSLSVKSGTFIIATNGTCCSRIDFSIPTGGGSSREVKATFTRQGSKLTMRWEGAGMTTGTIEGGTFTMKNEGMVLVYRK